MDYYLVLLKNGFPEEHVITINNLWWRLGLRRILINRRMYPLRELEGHK